MAENSPEVEEVGRWRTSAPHMSMEEKNLVLELYFKQRMSVADIAYKLDRKHQTILKFIRSVTDSTPVAQAMLRAGAVKLAKRILDKADVDQSIEILSRPNIGVLDPVKKNAEGPQIMISVNTESIGAVAPVPLAPASSPQGVLTIPGDSARLVGEGGVHGRERLLPSGVREGTPSGGPNHEGGHEVSSAPSAGLCSASDGASAPSGPSGVERNPGNVGPGRQGRVTVAQPPIRLGYRGPKKAVGDEPRTALVNQQRPRSSINLRYDVVEADEDEEE